MIHPIIVERLSKSFGKTLAVDDLSFHVEKGEIFGLLGPNGAGKTTAIRCALGLLPADRGSAYILGGLMEEGKKNRIGYMPEERGLYQDIPLEMCLNYLSRLKGLSSAEVHRRLDGWLERFDLMDQKKKKVKELSKGMQQKAQIITTILHQPELIIVDEPFSGLDPVNTSIVKELLRQLSQNGTTILMSTHQMHLVEELCDRILLINHGREVLYGPLDEVRRQFAGHAVRLRIMDDLPPLTGVERVERQNGSIRLALSPEVVPQDVLRTLMDTGVTVEGFEVAMPSLDEIFIQAVRGGQD